MSENSSEIRCTPLLGGKEAGGVCSLLEIGGYRILLDCGCTLTTPNEVILSVAKQLHADGGIDCLILSHADIHHVGAIPIMFGSKSDLSPVPIVCTLPVSKFTILTLYDLSLNIAMEGVPNPEAATAEGGGDGDGDGTGTGDGNNTNSGGLDDSNAAADMEIKRPMFTLDDIDYSINNGGGIGTTSTSIATDGGIDININNNNKFINYGNIISTKYNQTISINYVIHHIKNNKNLHTTGQTTNVRTIDDNINQVNFTAYSSGRTIGGACWDIRHCSTSVSDEV
jgi:Cft2 family RNA processing exonuclease